MAERQLTGRHVLMIFVGAFTVIIGVNIALAYNAVRTFPGLEVKNSYVASQEFNTRRAAQVALGWTVDLRHTERVGDHVDPRRRRCPGPGRGDGGDDRPRHRTAG